MLNDALREGTMHSDRWANVMTVLWRGIVSTITGPLWELTDSSPTGDQ